MLCSRQILLYFTFFLLYFKIALDFVLYCDYSKLEIHTHTHTHNNRDDTLSLLDWKKMLLEHIYYIHIPHVTRAAGYFRHPLAAAASSSLLGTASLAI